MNRNRRCANVIRKSLAYATASAMVISNIAYANESEPAAVKELPPQDTGALAGFMAASAQIHEGIIESQTVGELSADTNASPNWDNLMMANVDRYLNVRSLPGMEGDIIGLMRPSDVATVIGESGDWLQITSGDISGYVYKAYSLRGEEAKDVADTLCRTYAIATTVSAHIKSEPSKEAETIGLLKHNQVIEVNTEVAVPEGFVCVKVDDSTLGYISTEFISIEAGELGTAMTPDDMHSAESQNLALSRIKSAITSNPVMNFSLPGTIYNNPVYAGEDEVMLLAALLMCEAGSTYEGMLAVGGVVINRLNAGYADSITNVIYQRGQFSPAGSGKLANRLANGVTEDAIRAARDAISGVDITGGCRSFRAAFTGHAGTNIGGNVFF